MEYIYLSIVVIILALVADSIKFVSGYDNLKLISPFFPGALLYKVIIFLTFGLLWCASSFRYGIGTDYFNYYQRYIDIQTGSYTGEPLFLIVNRIASYFQNFQIVILITSTIFLFCIFRYIASNKVSWTWGLIIFMYSTFYNMSYNAVRQVVATSIFLIAIKYIKDKNFWKYLILILIAAGFHTLALAYLPLYFINYLNLSKKTFFYWLFGAVGVAVVYKLFGDYLSRYIPKLAEYTAANNSSANIQYLFFAFVNIIILIGIYYLLNTQKNSVAINSIEIKLQIILLLLIIVVYVFPLGYRMIFMLMPTQIVLVPRLLAGCKNSLMKIMIGSGFLITFLGTFMVAIVKLNWHETIPYVSVFQIFGQF